MNVESENKKIGRKLFYFPIVHTPADMGKLSGAVKEIYLKRVGRAGWKRKLDVVDKFWDQIAEIIFGLDLEKSVIRVYQDGLPVVSDGKEREIIERLAESGSRNHALVVQLLKRGAVLMGTESIELLMAEYELTQKLLERTSTPTRGGAKKILERQDDLLKQRDQFIADRINQTLRPGEIGILFLGLLHDVRPWLSNDIEVVCPIHIEGLRR
ncbi:MAG: hypothetical protein PHS86_04540 [Syntrophaceae bacterium]|nr:hypothetical protein [Syntrophaceae bacterium]